MSRLSTKKLTILAALLGTALASLAGAHPVVFRGATLHPVSGPEIPSGLLVIDGGKIVALGPDATVPAGAEVVDLTGKHVYPGFVHPSSQLGLTEIESIRATDDGTEIGEVNSDLRAETAVNADSLLLPVAVSGGVLTAHVVLDGGAWSGASAAIKLRGWTWEDMVLASGVGMQLQYPQALESGSAEETEELQSKALETVNETLEKARAYRKMVDAGGRVDYDAKLEGLLPVLAGEMALYVYAEEKATIENALDWAEEQGFEKLVLVTGPDAQYVAERLAEKKVPVILDGVNVLPPRRWEAYDMPFVAAARLHEAGVTFCIGDGGDSANARNLPFHAATAAAYGLPRDVALRSVTLSAAEILGVGDRVGSLEVGKDASFIVTTGDPLEIRTTIERVWIQGEEVDLSEDPQRRLYEKYNNRPRPGS